MTADPHPHLNLTTEQLAVLRDAARTTIKIDFADNRDHYFDTIGPKAYILTARGWTISANGDFFSDPRCAITDRELIMDVEDHMYDEDGEPFKYATAEGLWVSDLYYSGGRSPAQIGPDPYTNAAPMADVDPILVTASFETGGPLLWPDAWWFDRRTATAVTAPLRIECDHRVDYQDLGGQIHPEMALWQTDDGRWVGQVTAPEELDADFAGEDTVWCSLDARYVAHALYCADRTRLTGEGRDLPLVRHVLDLADTVNDLILPTGAVYLQSAMAGAEGRHPDTKRAKRTLTATPTYAI